MSTQSIEQIVLVRHGETEWSKSGQHTSRTDLSLIEEGRERAKALRSELAEWSFTLVLSSPLKRALETCELAGFGDRVELEENLREWDYGEYEGMTTPDIRDINPGWNLWHDGCPAGELPGEVTARADRALARMRAVGGVVLVFAHGHILRVLTARWLHMAPEAGARFVLAAGSVSVLGYERETEALRRWNA
jgi:broad specificity phosphatase PhoE